MKTRLLILSLLFAAVTVTAADERLVVHEWGTFTSLQAEDGRTLSGINTDDEALPNFVQTLGHSLISSPLSKGLVNVHPDVAMRLETPVIYFHPSKTMHLPMTLDVGVEFKGGWLTQFYPPADGVAPGMEPLSKKMGHLTPATVGTLNWRGLKIGVEAPLPETKYNVWLAPRAVDAATVANDQGKAEKYLFYRGVGNLNAPLKVSRTGTQGELQITAQLDPTLDKAADMQVRSLWLAHFKADGTCAFQTLTPGHFVLNEPEAKSVGVSVSAAFSPGQYGKENLGALRKSMREALIADGLFADEAEAMLNTWELSYFKSSGLRLFFIVPHAWTNNYLPLKISVPSELSRVMMGRIELTSPEQQQALDTLATATDFSDENARTLWPAVGALGRFNTPLILERLKKQPTPGLQFAAKRFTAPQFVFDK